MEATIVVAATVECNQSAPSCTTGVSCPSGFVVLGGGARGTEAKLETSFPLFDFGWLVSWYPAIEEYASAAAGEVKVFAVCTASLPGYERVESELTSCPFFVPRCTGTVACPPGKTVIAGGARGVEAKLESTYPADSETWAAAWYAATTQYASAAAGDAEIHALCADAPLAGYEVVTGATVTCKQTASSCTASVTCPVGKIAVGGGMLGTEAKIESSYPSDPSVTRTWTIAWYPATVEYASAAAGDAVPYVICIDGTSLPSEIFSDGFESGDLTAWSFAAP